MKVKTRIKNDKKRALAYAGALILFLLIILSSCAGDKEDKYVSTFMKNDRGTYNLMELSIPDGKGPYPVVLMAHGFAGTLHSGGAKELAKRLSDRGILAVMIDFDPFEEPDMKAERTHEYPLSQMREDAVKALRTVVAEYGGDKDNISLYGRSYGGRLMMQMANESTGGYKYRKLALVAPAGDAICFERYLGGKDVYDEMKAKAGKEGFAEKYYVKVTPQWFSDVEEYDPTKYGWKFGKRPVLLFYNTLDDVVYPDTSIRCAKAYKNHEIHKVTTEDSHGYEMGYPKSELKDKIMKRVADFLAE